MRFCPKCGSQNTDEATFCGQCGAQFPNAAAATQQAPAPAATQPVNFTGQVAQPVPGQVASASKSRLPMIIAAAVVLIAIVALVVVFVIPRCSGAAAGGSANLTALNTASTADARQTLSNMKSAELEGMRYYVSSDDVSAYVNDVIARGERGDLSDWSDVMNAEVAKKLNGQWVLVSLADSSFEQYVNEYKQRYGFDLGHMTIYATVVADDDLTNEEVANLVSKAGLNYEHAIVFDATVSDAMSAVSRYIKLASTASGSSSSYGAYADYYADSISSEIQEYGVKGASIGQFYAADTMGVSCAVQLDGYALVLLWSDAPSSYGLDSLVNADSVGRMYVK